MIAITPKVQKTMLVIGLTTVALVGCRVTTPNTLAPKALSTQGELTKRVGDLEWQQLEQQKLNKFQVEQINGLARRTAILQKQVDALSHK